MDGEGAKMDVRRRIQVSQERRKVLLAESSRSGMTGHRFAKGGGVNYSTYAGLRARQRREKITGAAIVRSSRG